MQKIKRAKKTSIFQASIKYNVRLFSFGLRCSFSFLHDHLRRGKGREEGEWLGKQMKNALLGAVLKHLRSLQTL